MESISNNRLLDHNSINIFGNPSHTLHCHGNIRILLDCHGLINNILHPHGKNLQITDTSPIRKIIPHSNQCGHRIGKSLRDHSTHPSGHCLGHRIHCNMLSNYPQMFHLHYALSYLPSQILILIVDLSNMLNLFKIQCMTLLPLNVMSCG